MLNIPRKLHKIEALGLSEECIKNKMMGLGANRNAKVLSEIVDEDISSANVVSFFEQLEKKLAENKDLTLKLDNIVKKSTMKTLNNWKKMDEMLGELVEGARSVQEKLIGVDKKTGKPIIFKTKDWYLYNKSLLTIARITEIRAKCIGQIQTGGVTFNFNKIENQYNQLQQLIVDAEETFPGIGGWVEQRMLKDVPKAPKRGPVA